MKITIDILKNLDTGLYYFPNASSVVDWDQLQSVQGWKIFHLEGSTITNQEEYLEKLTQSLEATEDCTYNFDMMLDCLRLIPEYSTSASRYVIAYTNYDTFLSHDKEKFNLALYVFYHAVLTWREKLPNTQLNIILMGQKRELPEYVEMV